ncbi:MAG: hypothetical protein QW204_01550, partial [Thermoplasmata archaeon]
NMMGIFAIISAIFFIYWAYNMSKRMRMRSQASSQAKVSDERVEEGHGEFIFCTECELIEGRANICKGCPKAGEVKNGYPGKKTF